MEHILRGSLMPALSRELLERLAAARCPRKLACGPDPRKATGTSGSLRHRHWPPGGPREPMKRTLQVSALALAPAGGLRHRAKTQRCASPRRAPNERSFPTPDTWFALLLHGYDKDTGAAPAPGGGLHGRARGVAQDPRPPTSAGRPAPSPRPCRLRRSWTEEDLRPGDAPGRAAAGVGDHAALHQRRGPGPGGAGGDAPSRASASEALGSLRAMPKNAKLRLEKVRAPRTSSWPRAMRAPRRARRCAAGTPASCRCGSDRFFTESVSDTGARVPGRRVVPARRAS